ncbi:MAG TPA: hypothetical protein P5038_21130 [Candidatus Paceibacterota bacterium]|nr:hypothetical protein [Candidatus Paceibacterota bacterium]
MKRLVECIVAARRANAAADTRAWEREMDERVYRRCGLTPEEIQIVEGTAK